MLPISWLNLSSIQPRVKKEPSVVLCFCHLGLASITVSLRWLKLKKKVETSIATNAKGLTSINFWHSPHYYPYCCFPHHPLHLPVLRCISLSSQPWFIYREVIWISQGSAEGSRRVFSFASQAPLSFSTLFLSLTCLLVIQQ